MIEYLLFRVKDEPVTYCDVTDILACVGEIERK